MTLMKAKLAHNQENAIVRMKNVPNCNGRKRQKPPKPLRKCENSARKNLTLMKYWRLQNNSGIEASTDVPIPVQYHIAY